MKKKKMKFKENFIYFIKELGVAVLLCILFLGLLVVGGVIMSIFPKQISKIFPVEVLALIGFFAVLVLLFTVSKVSEVLQKIKTHSSKTDNSNQKEQAQHEEKQ